MRRHSMDRDTWACGQEISRRKVNIRLRHTAGADGLRCRCDWEDRELDGDHLKIVHEMAVDVERSLVPSMLCVCRCLAHWSLDPYCTCRT